MTTKELKMTMKEFRKLMNAQKSLTLMSLLSTISFEKIDKGLIGIKIDRVHYFQNFEQAFDIYRILSKKLLILTSYTEEVK